MAKKIITLPAFIVLALAAVSIIAIAAQIFGPVWSNGLPVMSITKGQSATFSFDLGSVNPPITYSVDLYNTANNQLISNIKSASNGAKAFTDTITVNPADYNNLGGSYRVEITAVDAVGVNAYDESLMLIVTQQAPVVSNIPDVTLNAGTSVQPFQLNNYVTDADDPISSLTWSIVGNDTNVSASIDTLNSNQVTITANENFTGTQTLTFTATDPSGATSSDNVTVTVLPFGSPLPGTTSSTAKSVTIHNLNLEVSDGNFLMIRNRGNRLDGLRLNFNVEAAGSQEQFFTMDLDSNTLSYKPLDFEGIAPGTYLAKVDVSDANDDFSESTYMLVDVN